MKSFVGFRSIIGFLISAILLFLVLRNIDFSDTLSALKAADYRLVLTGACLALVLGFARSLRWKYLFETDPTRPLLDFIAAFFIGFLANSVLPARLGEIVRAKAFGNFSRIGGTKSLSSIFVEKALDGLVLLVFYVTLTFFYSSPPWMQRTSWVAAVVFTGLFALICTALAFRESFRNAMLKALSWASNDMRLRISDIITWFIEGFTVLKNRHNMLSFLSFTFLIWAIEGCMIYIFIRSANIDAPFVSGYFVMILLGFAIAIPSAPGYIGVYQFVCVKTLAIWAVDPSHALSFSLLMQCAMYLPLNLIGLAFLVSSNSRFRNVLASRGG